MACLGGVSFQIPQLMNRIALHNHARLGRLHRRPEFPSTTHNRGRRTPAYSAHPVGQPGGRRFACEQLQSRTIFCPSPRTTSATSTNALTIRCVTGHAARWHPDTEGRSIPPQRQAPPQQGGQGAFAAPLVRACQRDAQHGGIHTARAWRSSRGSSRLCHSTSRPLYKINFHEKRDAIPNFSAIISPQ